MIAQKYLDMLGGTSVIRQLAGRASASWRITEVPPSDTSVQSFCVPSLPFIRPVRRPAGPASTTRSRRAAASAARVTGRPPAAVPAGYGSPTARRTCSPALRAVCTSTLLSPTYRVAAGSSPGRQQRPGPLGRRLDRSVGALAPAGRGRVPGQRVRLVGEDRPAHAGSLEPAQHGRDARVGGGLVGRAP